MSKQVVELAGETLTALEALAEAVCLLSSGAPDPTDSERVEHCAASLHWLVSETGESEAEILQWVDPGTPMTSIDTWVEEVLDEDGEARLQEVAEVVEAEAYERVIRVMRALDAEPHVEASEVGDRDPAACAVSWDVTVDVADVRVKVLDRGEVPRGEGADAIEGEVVAHRCAGCGEWFDADRWGDLPHHGCEALVCEVSGWAIDGGDHCGHCHQDDAWHPWMTTTEIIDAAPRWVATAVAKYTAARAAGQSHEDALEDATVLPESTDFAEGLLAGPDGIFWFGMIAGWEHTTEPQRPEVWPGD